MVRSEDQRRRSWAEKLGRPGDSERIRGATDYGTVHGQPNIQENCGQGRNIHQTSNRETNSSEFESEKQKPGQLQRFERRQLF